MFVVAYSVFVLLKISVFRQKRNDVHLLKYGIQKVCEVTQCHDHT